MIVCLSKLSHSRVFTTCQLIHCLPKLCGTTSKGATCCDIIFSQNQKLDFHTRFGCNSTITASAATPLQSLAASNQHVQPSTFQFRHLKHCLQQVLGGECPAISLCIVVWICQPCAFSSTALNTWNHNREYTHNSQKYTCWEYANSSNFALLVPEAARSTAT